MRISTCRTALLPLLMPLSRPHLDDEDLMGVIVKQPERRRRKLGHARKAQAALTGLGIVYTHGRSLWAVFVGIKAYGTPLSILGFELRLISLFHLVPLHVADPTDVGLFPRAVVLVPRGLESKDRSAVAVSPSLEPGEQRHRGGYGARHLQEAPYNKRDGLSKSELPDRQRLRPVLGPDRGADQIAVAVIDLLDVAAGLEGDLAAVGEHDGVALVPVAGTAGRVELGDDPAAVAIEHTLLRERAVGAVGVDVGAPRLLLAAVDDGLAARARRRAAASRPRPLAAIAMPGRDAGLVRVVSVTRARAVAGLQRAARCFEIICRHVTPPMCVHPRAGRIPAAGAAVERVDRFAAERPLSREEESEPRWVPSALSPYQDAVRRPCRRKPLRG